MRRTGNSKTRVWRRQERFAEAGVDGLLRDKKRRSRVKPMEQTVTHRVVALTAAEPPREATHRILPTRAKLVSISVSSVQRIWRSHGLAPHRMRHFKLFNDPDFVPKPRVIVRLHVDSAGACGGAVGILIAGGTRSIQICDRLTICCNCW